MPHGPGGVSEPRWPHSLKANLTSLARQGHQSSLPLPPDQRGSAPLNQFTPTPSTGEKERLWAEGGLVPDLGLTRGAGPFRSLGGTCLLSATRPRCHRGSRGAPSSRGSPAIIPTSPVTPISLKRESKRFLPSGLRFANGT